MQAFTDKRPWGEFKQFTHNEESTVKIITVNKGQRFSLQKHHNRDEFWVVLSGNGIARIGEQEMSVGVGVEINIPKGTAHRMQAIDSDIIFLEIAQGNFDEDDIERLSDDYGRN